MSDNGQRLLGRWRLVRADAALTFAPDVCMEFLSGGRLLYEFVAGGKRHIVRLLYRVDGEMLRTDNPTAPHEATAMFRFGAGGVLVFDFAGACAFFIREMETGGRRPEAKDQSSDIADQGDDRL